MRGGGDALSYSSHTRTMMPGLKRKPSIRRPRRFHRFVYSLSEAPATGKAFAVAAILLLSVLHLRLYDPHTSLSRAAADTRRTLGRGDARMLRAKLDPSSFALEDPRGAVRENGPHPASTMGLGDDESPHGGGAVMVAARSSTASTEPTIESLPSSALVNDTRTSSPVADRTAIKA